jgi:hypothetical protein
MESAQGEGFVLVSMMAVWGKGVVWGIPEWEKFFKTGGSDGERLVDFD